MVMKKLFAAAAILFCMTFSSGDAGETHPSGVSMQQVRNATIRITYRDKIFLVDPWFAPKDSAPPIPMSFHPRVRFPMADLPMPIEEIVKADAVILTHLHPDHFDEIAAKALPKDIKFYVQDEYDAEAMRNFGFTNIEILQYDGNAVADITLYKTDCIHGVRKLAEPYYKMMGLRWEAAGVIFAHPDEKTVYVAGDTIWCDEVKAALEKHNPDIVILNTADAQLLTSGSIIMGLRDLVEVVQATPETTTIIASHMDTVSHAMVTRKDIREYVTGYDLSYKVLVPEDGETLYLGKR